MEKLRKIAVIGGYYDSEVTKVVKTLENQGFIMVDDDENEIGYKTWYVVVKA